MNPQIFLGKINTIIGFKRLDHLVIFGGLPIIYILLNNVQRTNP